MAAGVTERWEMSEAKKKSEKKWRGWDESERSDVLAAVTHYDAHCTDCIKGSVGDVELVEIFANVVNVTLRDETLSLKGWRYFTKLWIHKKILEKLFHYREEEKTRHLLTFSQNSLPPLKRNCSPGVTGGRWSVSLSCGEQWERVHLSSEVRVSAWSSFAAFLLEMCKDTVNKQSDMSHTRLIKMCCLSQEDVG